jgi:cellulose synthase/poly-beta-1,6-N-acetylglucosamine synthase-like glycosyltransferase
MSAIFWVSFILLIYPVFLFPALLTLLPKKRIKLPKDGGGELPSVSILVSVYNEEAVIEQKIANFLDLDYPDDLLELLIISDGSSDNTDNLVRACPSDRVRLLRQEERQGKTRALNRAVAEAGGDILFFSDADSMLKKDCLKKLVRPFNDGRVGLVSGRSVYLDKQGAETTGSLYRRFEEWMKEKEGYLYGIVGADGAVYAMRRELYTPLLPEFINDLLHPIQVVTAGKMAVTVPDALVLEPAPEMDSRSEFARQTRIMAQSWLVFIRHTGSIIKNGRFGFFWEFASHKVLRWLSLPFMFLAALTSWCFFALTVLLCGLAFWGAKGRGGRIARIAWLFILQGAAALNGLFRLLKGDKFVTWAPRNL